MKTSTRRTSVIAVMFIAMMLIVSTTVYATDEESATAENVISEEAVEETEKEEVITEEQTAEDPEPVLKEEPPKGELETVLQEEQAEPEGEDVSAGAADIESVQEETQDPVSAPAPQSSPIATPVVKTAIEIAVDRVKAGGRSVDLSGLKIPEGDMDRLMSAIVDAGLVSEDDNISFISMDGYITSYEVNLDITDEDDSEAETDPAPSPVKVTEPSIEAPAQIQVDDSTTEPLILQKTAQRTEIPEEGSAEQPVSGLLGLLALIASGIRHALIALH